MTSDGQINYLRRCDSEKMSRLFTRPIEQSTTIHLSNSPQLLCSGEVLRYQLNRPLKPVSLITVKPIRPVRAGTNSVLVPSSMGAVLPAAFKSVADDWVGGKKINSLGALTALKKTSICRNYEAVF